MNRTRNSRRERWFAAYVLLGLVVGIGTLYWLLARVGGDLDWHRLKQSLPALLLVLPWFMLPLAAATESWRRLFPAGTEPGMGRALELTWIGMAVNWLLPVATVGGEVVKFRLGLKENMRVYALAASLVADKTLQLVTQIVFILFGVGLLLWDAGRLDWHVGGGFTLAGMTLVVYLFYRLQKAGMFSGLAAGFGRIAATERRTHLRAARFDAAVRRVYRRRRAWWESAGWRMLFRVFMAGEVALVMLWLGHGEVLVAALVLESLAQGARSAAFFVPAGLGVQEGALVGAGLLLGLPTETLLAIAVIKRGREVVIGGPALLVWQWRELIRLWRRLRGSRGQGG